MRQINEENLSNFSLKLQNTDWCIEDFDVNAMYNAFNNKFSTTYNVNPGGAMWLRAVSF